MVDWPGAVGVSEHAVHASITAAQTTQVQEKLAFRVQGLGLRTMWGSMPQAQVEEAWGSALSALQLASLRWVQDASR